MTSEGPKKRSTPDSNELKKVPYEDKKCWNSCGGAGNCYGCGKWLCELDLDREENEIRPTQCRCDRSFCSDCDGAHVEQSSDEENKGGYKKRRLKETRKVPYDDPESCWNSCGGAGSCDGCGKCVCGYNPDDEDDEVHPMSVHCSKCDRSFCSECDYIHSHIK